MVDNMDGSYHCDTCGRTGRIPRSLLMNRKLPDPWHTWQPVAGRINDEFLFVQFNNSVMIMDYDQADEVIEALTELLSKKDGNAQDSVANDS